MRIAFVSTSYFPRINGVTFSVEAFARVFRTMGHDVYIIAPEFPGYVEKDDKVIRIHSHYFFIDPEDRIPNPWHPASKYSIRKILSLNFDIIHTHVPFFLEGAAIGWARKMRCPLVNTYHTHWEHYKHYVKFLPEKILVAYLKPILRRFLNSHDLILTPSSQMVEVLHSYLVKRRIEVLPTGIDLAKFRGHGGDDFRKRMGISKEIKLLLFVGRIGQEKNIPFLFQVLKRIIPKYPDVLLLLAGDGPSRKALWSMARREGLDRYVRFIGYLTDELISCYDAADIFVFSSLTETQGIVLTEAMATGTPVVAVSALGVIDVMRGSRGGFLVEHDIDRFSEAVLSLLGDRNLYNQKRKDALQCARESTIENEALKVLGFYEELLASGKRSVRNSPC